MARAAILALALLLAWCKSPKYDRTLECPGLHAVGVAVYVWDSGLFIVRYPDHTYKVVSEIGCVLSGG